MRKIMVVFSKYKMMLFKVQLFQRLEFGGFVIINYFGYERRDLYSVFFFVFLVFDFVRYVWF